MKLKILFLVLCSVVCVHGAYAQSSKASEGVSRQVTSLKNMMESYRAATDSRIQAAETRLGTLETQFQPCASGEEYGELRSSNCAPGQIGIRLDQCRDGSWHQEVDTCSFIERVYSKHNHAGVAGTADITAAIAANTGITQHFDHLVFHPDTMDEFCRLEGFARHKAGAGGAKGFNSCGNNNLLAYIDVPGKHGIHPPAGTTFTPHWAIIPACNHNSLVWTTMTCTNF